MFEPLPALIRLERERQNLTQEKLARLAKVSRTWIVQLEKGEGNISLGLLMKVANALGMTDLRIGALHLHDSAPELTVVVAAANALDTALKVIDQAAAAQADLQRASVEMSALLERLLRAVPDPGIARGAERMIAGGLADPSALRELAETPDTARATRTKAEPKAKTRRAAR